MQIAKNKIRFYFYAGSVFSIIILTILFYFNISESLQNEYKRKVDQLSTGVSNGDKVPDIDGLKVPLLRHK
ncbi:MAG: hypothetical protein U5P10_05930 [Spirochaetia bacterium]|nr:hypothetical protein [Spirochaetia bacterium]